MQARREGFALAATILAMLVVGAIVTGGFYAASQEGHTSHSLVSSDEAVYIAETGLNAGMTTSPVQLEALRVDSSMNSGAVNVVLGTTVLGNYMVHITRVDTALYLMASIGTVTRGGRYAGATRALANMIRLRTAFFESKAAVVAYGDLNVTGTADIDGTDVFPVGWVGQNCAVEPGTSAVVTNPTTTVSTGGGGQITGPVTRDTLTADDFTVFGDVTWNDLVALKEKTVTGTISPVASINIATGLCNTADNNNWGSPVPATPCYSYFPIIYAPGDLRINATTSGQGFLLVEGDLEISGGFDFFGIVVVKGEIRMTGTGGHVNGTTLVFGGGDIDSNAFAAGNSLLQYSSCAIKRALLNNTNLTRAIPIAHRSWMDVSAIQGGN